MTKAAKLPDGEQIRPFASTNCLLHLLGREARRARRPVNLKEVLNRLQHDVDVDARLLLLLDYVELVLGGAGGLSYSDSDRDSLRTAIVQLLAVRWVQGRQEEDDRFAVATDHGGPRTTMPSEPPDPSGSPEERRRAFYSVPSA
jgi:hypothetical protein